MFPLFFVVLLLGVVAGETLLADPRSIALFAWMAFTAFIAGRQLLYAEATVGADGHGTRGSKKLPTFIPWRDVDAVFVEQASADTTAQALCVQRRDGSVVRIPRLERPPELLEACEVALKQYREREPVKVPEALRDDAAEAEGYREAAIPTPLLVRVAEDPGVDAAVRVRAAKRAASAGGKGAMAEVVQVMADREMRKRLKEAIR